MSDLQAKYQRLASEYSKLKAQIPVLKKAVVDEQALQEKLKVNIKEKDQSVRKYEQEVDSLTFRNQQLAKRVLFLQEELEQVSTTKRKNKVSYSSTILLLPYILIYSNYYHHLHLIVYNVLQVFETQQEYDSQLHKLQEQLSKYEKESSQHHEVLSLTVQKGKSEVEKLQQDKAMMEVKIQTQQGQIREYKNQAERIEDHLRDVQKHLTRKLNNATKVIESNLPFIDSSISEYNSLNLPTHDRKYQLQARELMSQAVNIVSAFAQAFANFCSYSEQRAHSISTMESHDHPLSVINKKYAHFLFESAPYFKKLEKTLKEFNEEVGENCFTTLETAVGLQPFAKAFHLAAAYLNKLLPYQQESLHQECALSTCTSMLEAKNKDLSQSYQKLNAVINRLDTYINILGAQSHKSYSHCKRNHKRFFSELTTSVTYLHEAIKDVSKHFNSKISMEHQLPTASQSLKTSDECIVSSLVSLVTSTGKLSAFLSGNQDFLTQRVNYRLRGSSTGDTTQHQEDHTNPIVALYRERAVKYLESIQSAQPESVPHRMAIQNRKMLLSSTESKESLLKQLQTFQQKVGKLEQQKEHYMLELQLLKMKYENEIQKVKQLEKLLEDPQKLSGRSSVLSHVMGETSAANTVTGGESEHFDSSTQHSPSLDSRTGHIPISDGDSREQLMKASSVDADSREQLIKDHLTNRINQLTLNLQLAESKAINFHAEVRALHKRLAIAEEAKEKSIEELKQATTVQAQLKDELATTTRSYEGQLRMMSEHLASMNEKLTTQKDEIDELKMQQAMSKGQKKFKK
ncbi:protein phosphatase 1 regulatory subunit 21 [Octopus bimaculoides]|nr:protein phosphatase 1 regulatory subunit 21 [Octopus bimaculoides]